MAVGAGVVEFEQVWHVGTLNVADRSDFSFEGDGLSVSVHPDDWASIAGLAGPQWVITAPNGPLRLLDARTVDTEQVMAWAAEHGWVQQVPVHRVTYFDDEADEERYLTLLDADEAALEAEEREAEVVTGTGWVATDAHPCTRRSMHGTPNPVDETLTEWVRTTRPDLHGLWWEERYDPWNLSCPRGALTAPLTGLVVSAT